jgi:hypothetical protein
MFLWFPISAQADQISNGKNKEIQSNVFLAFIDYY